MNALANETSPVITHTRSRIDPSRSSVEFHVRSLYGLQTVKGRFERYDGTLDLSAQPSIELTIQEDSLTTDNARRDEHLRSADFFDSANHPQVRFVSQLATLDADRLRVRGELHAAGNSIPLELEGVIRPDGDELDVDVTTFADHRRLGMTFNRLGVICSPSELIVRERLVRDARGANRPLPARTLCARRDRAHRPPRDLRFGHVYDVTTGPFPTTVSSAAPESLPSVDTEDIRLAVYRSFADTGRPPARGSLDDQAMRELEEQGHVVLSADGEIVMAHPFASVPLGFSVMGRDTLWWGGCAWDSFALPHLLPDEPDVLVATRCPGCDAALAWVVGRDAPPVGDEVAHFLIPVARMWDDVVHTCGNQRLFCSDECVAAWLARTGHKRGYVMNLGTLWRLARGWYAGRLEHGYRRRKPAEAQAYFRSVGLSGPFWGL